MGISTGKLKIYTIDCSKYWAKNKYNTIITAPRRYRHPPSGANRPSDIAVTMIINGEVNLSLIRWQLSPYFNAIEGISSPSIVMVQSREQSTLHLPILLNPFQVAQAWVYPTCQCVCMEKKLFLHSLRWTSLSDYALPRFSPWPESGHMKCAKSC